jgi:hypothetical protein
LSTIELPPDQGLAHVGSVISIGAAEAIDPMAA